MIAVDTGMLINDAAEPGEFPNGITTNSGELNPL